MQVAFQHYRRALAQWPADVLRPEVSFRKAIGNRTEGRFRVAKDEPDQIGKGSAEVKALPPVWKESSELEQVNALYSLLEDRYSKRVRCLFVIPRLMLC